ncbi:hypothetical protein B0H10DRAFT_2234855 [Mycena sp. CBHHK59/15]|nr:hypothetical protein B0H10DRAFT_2234855 [Mycena sp. CBHHK59/15]
MCDERTASKLTAPDTARRNNLGAENLVRYPIVASIPTLRDLLNPDMTNNEPVDEEALFNAADPYGIEDLEAMEEGEDETDTSPPPLVIRRADVLNFVRPIKNPIFLTYLADFALIVAY